ncbi:MAG: hypothetical protein HYX71_12365 [Opitutae bacterium]|nr:hypothetical protein [Opitutae bacterium]
MFSRLPVRPLLAALFAAAALHGAEQNGWPLVVRQPAEGGAPGSVQCLGPLLFSRQDRDLVQGFRPFWLRAVAGDKETSTLLYPLFTWQLEAGDSHFSLSQLVNGRRTGVTGGGAGTRGFDAWPFYFSRETGDPATSYRALFPVAGTIRHRFGRQELSWYAFPFYLHSTKAGREITTAPWPFLRFIGGEGHKGFEFWPLFGRRGRENDYAEQFCLWPLFYKSIHGLSEATPTVKLGALPFYTRETAPGSISETYVWPFFGYTHRTAPHRYDEQRYLWPFLVQGHGDQRHINRWAPVYTHSVIKGYDKTWLFWPLFRHAAWQDAGLAQEKNQLLYFLYWSQSQRSLTHPGAAPAHKTHLWPLFSAWDNGAGHRQVQAFSPLEVFFQNNEAVRQLYTPLFALYRYDRTDAATSRHSLLWDAVTWRRTAAEKEFHLGPLFSVETGAERQRVTLGNGLLGLKRRPGERAWRLFLFDFSRKTTTKTAGAPPP